MKKDFIEEKRDSIWANVALLILYPYSFLTGLSQMQGIHIIYPAFALSIVVFIFIGLTNRNKSLLTKYRTLLIFVCCFIILNILFVGNTDIKNILYGVFIMPCLGALLFFYRIRYWVALALFYSVSLFFVLYIFQNGPFVNEETELLVNSRNYVSFFVLLYALPYFVHCNDYNKIPSLIVPMVCVLVSVFALGRSGIICSMGLLAGVLYLKMTQKSKIRIVYRITFFSIIIITIAIGLGGDFFDTYFSTFEEKGMKSTDRTQSWLEYILSWFNPINLLLGTPIESLKHTMSYLAGSLHNSYLTLHAREGLVGLFLIVYMLKGWWQLYKKKFYPLCLIFLVLLIKGLTDADTGGSYSGGDIYVFYLALVYMYYHKNKKINERKSISPVSTAVSSNT